MISTDICFCQMNLASSSSGILTVGFCKMDVTHYHHHWEFWYVGSLYDDKLTTEGKKRLWKITFEPSVWKFQMEFVFMTSGSSGGQSYFETKLHVERDFKNILRSTFSTGSAAPELALAPLAIYSPILWSSLVLLASWSTRPSPSALLLTQKIIFRGVVWTWTYSASLYSSVGSSCSVQQLPLGRTGSSVCLCWLVRNFGASSVAHNHHGTTVVVFQV